MVKTSDSDCFLADTNAEGAAGSLAGGSTDELDVDTAWPSSTIFSLFMAGEVITNYPVQLQRTWYLVVQLKPS